MLKRKNIEFGFNLVEVMVVIVIFTIVIGASYAILSSGRQSWFTGDIKISLEEEMRQGLNEMIYELSQSTVIDSLGFTRLSIGAGGDSITFQVPVDENANGSLEDTDGDGTPDFYFAYPLDNDGLPVWGAYLRNEDKTQPSARQGRWVRYILTNIDIATNTGEIRRQILNADQTAVIEDFLLVRFVRDPISDSLLVAIFSLTADQQVVVITLNARRLTIDRHQVDYSILTSVYLRSY